jgi:hypothetical protein
MTDAIRGMKTINQVAQEYSVHPIQVGLWKICLGCACHISRR